ncbi:MAG: replication-associated recombination protein A [Verrucomicrobia bacterium]|nr:replication-associated recombination protein A [Verrucomicrobiota bacterium]
MKPLAEQLRPQEISDIVGQDHLLGPEGLITRIISSQKPVSLLLWGPPGCGKTTLARLYAKAFNAEFIPMSAVFHGTADLKKWIEEARSQPLFRKIIFVDEIHRFNKAQQDVFLPFVEDGTILLVGATTENPSFALNNALLSRLRVLPLKSLDETSLSHILERYEKTHKPLPLTASARTLLLSLSQGDGRYLLNMIENIEDTKKSLDEKALLTLVQRRPALYDKHDDGHYNLISALHKSVRGSDADAALYYFSRMLEGGESPEYIARRMVRMAVEDIGLADPDALNIALNAWRAYDQLGSPEGDLALAQALLYLALAPKSNAAYTALSAAKEAAGKTGHLSPPKTILNAPTRLMREMDYGKDYIYDHDTPEGFSGQNYFPDDMPREEFYHPIERGFERELKRRAEYFQRLRERA